MACLCVTPQKAPTCPSARLLNPGHTVISLKIGPLHTVISQDRPEIFLLRGGGIWKSNLFLCGKQWPKVLCVTHNVYSVFNPVPPGNEVGSRTVKTISQVYSTIMCIVYKYMYNTTLWHYTISINTVRWTTFQSNAKKASSLALVKSTKIHVRGIQS